jgi:hypothetical protein
VKFKVKSPGAVDLGGASFFEASRTFFLQIIIGVAVPTRAKIGFIEQESAIDPRALEQPDFQPPELGLWPT